MRIILRGVLEPKEEEVTGECRKLHEALHNVYSLTNIKVIE
jgi:hypothetical protein